MLTHPNHTANKILLIDDSLVDMRVLTELLVRRKFRVTVAFNGNDGYRKAVLEQPDLILLDVKMPGMDGFATCRLLKANKTTHDITVIFLTAANETVQRLEGLALGAVDYLAKPFVVEEEVLARIELHLNLARRSAHLRIAPTVEATQQESDTLVPTHSRALVKTAKEFLLRDITSPPPPEQLAHLLGTNEKKLNDAFRLVTAKSVFAWVREARMRRARYLLEQTETLVRKIGEHLGYPNPANFSTAFRERYGVSPRDFRAGLRRRREDDDDAQNRS